MFLPAVIFFNLKGIPFGIIFKEVTPAGTCLMAAGFSYLKTFLFVRKMVGNGAVAQR